MERGIIHEVRNVMCFICAPLVCSHFVNILNLASICSFVSSSVKVIHKVNRKVDMKRMYLEEMVRSFACCLVAFLLYFAMIDISYGLGELITCC